MKDKMKQKKVYKSNHKCNFLKFNSVALGGFELRICGSEA